MNIELKMKNILSGAFLLGNLVVLAGCASLQHTQVEKPEGLTEAIAELQGTTSTESEPVINAFELTDLADYAYDSENWALAEKYYRKLIKLVPQDPYAYFRLGNVLMQQARVNKAVGAYTQAITRDPRHTRALKNRSLAFLLQAEMLLEQTVRILQEEEDDSAINYRGALLNLQRLNGLPLNETVSPVAGLFMDGSDVSLQSEEVKTVAYRSMFGSPTANAGSVEEKTVVARSNSTQTFADRIID